MKKKIINGILLVAMLFATSSAFVSCKDNDADSQTETLSKIAALQSQLDNIKQQVGPQGPKGDTGATGAAGQDGKDGHTPEITIGDNGNWFIDGVDTGKPSQGAPGLDGADGVTPEFNITIGDNGNWFINGEDTGKPSQGASADNTEILAKIALLEKAIEDLDLSNYVTSDALASMIAKIDAGIQALQAQVDAIYKTMITSISVDQVSNPLFDFITPFDVQTNLLIACYGDAKKDIYFPTPSGAEPLISAGEKIMNKTGNAGTIYATINPSSVDFSGKPLLLVNTAGEVAPVTLSNAVASNKVISFTTRAANALYATEATVAAEDIEKIDFKYKTDDVQTLKDNIKAFLKERNKHNLAELAQNVINIFYSNKMQAYRLQATWGNNNNTFSEANIAAIAVKPLTYDFDLNTAAEYDGSSLSALEKLENKILVIISPSESSREKVWKWIDKFNKEVAAKILNNVNNAVQPTMLYESENQIGHMHAGGSVNTIKAGEIKLYPTSWTGEVIAPAFKKYVAVTEVTDLNGTPLNGVVNTGNMGKIIDGKINTIPFTIEAGKIYTLVYTAMDYSGLTRTLEYKIQGE